MRFFNWDIINGTFRQNWLEKSLLPMKSELELMPKLPFGSQISKVNVLAH